MKKSIVLVCIFMLFAGAVFAQNRPEITVVNNTGYTIYYLYVSPATSDGWGNDVLGSSQTLRSGYEIRVSLPYPLESERFYDFRAVDEDDDSYYKWNVRITPNSRVVFVFDDIDLD